MKVLFSLFIFRKARANLLCILALILFANRLKAQEDAVWVFGEDDGSFSLDFNNEPPLLSAISLSKMRVKTRSSVSVCDKNGKLLFYSRSDTLYFSVKDKFIPISTNMLLYETLVLQTSSPDKYMMVGVTGPRNTSKFIDSLILLELDIKSQKIRNVGLLDTFTHGTYPVKLALSSPNSVGLQWIYAINRNETFVYSYDTVNGVRRIKDLYPGIFYLKGYNQEFFSSSLSHSNGFLASTDFIQPFNDTNFYRGNNRLVLYRANIETGELTQRQIVDENTETYQVRKNLDLRYKYNHIEFSPNDSILYMIKEKSSDGEPGRELYLMQYNIHNAPAYPKSYSILLGNSEQWPLDMKLGPNGKIYLIPYSHTDNIFVINDPDNWGAACNVMKNHYDLKSVGGHLYDQYATLHEWPNTISAYKRVSFIGETICDGRRMVLTNTSDSIHWERYRFYFGDGDSADMNDQTRLKDGSWGVEHTYKNPGKYFVKLRAYNASGGWAWFSDSITVLPSPVAGFSLTDTTGCQWIAYRFKNESVVFPKGKTISYHWQFGDNTDTLFDNNTPVFTHRPMQHTYTKNGTYNVTLIVNDGFCVDTFSLQNTVEILAAPRPGISVNSDKGCTPFELKVDRKYADAADSLCWNFGDGSPAVTLRQAQGNALTHTYKQSGDFQLTQTLYGETGCITADTLKIKVEQGFDPDYTPELIRASIENRNEVQVSWKENPMAKEYNLYRNETRVATLPETSYKEAYLTPAATYTVRAVNICDEESPESNQGRLILLAGNQQENNLALVEWTAYEEWPQGVANYILEAYTEGPNGTGIGDFKTLDVLGTESRKTEDPEYRQDMAAQKCYRIKAISATQDIISHSNTLCLPYTPVFFVPTAFSPNSDGLNDAFVPYSLGISGYTIRIFNRWGEQIFEGQNWDGKVKDRIAMPGSYQYVIEGKTIEGLNLHAKGSVLLVR